MIDVVIPTMWIVKDVVSRLEKYIECPLINKIILIDNNPKKRPKSSIFNNPKIELVCYGSNIYVNPAWNEGYLRSTSDVIAIINDDILVDSDIFYMVKNFNLKAGEMIGVDLKGYKDNFKIDDVIDTKEEIVDFNYNKNYPIGGQAWAFGICMFIHKHTYKLIPSLYKIWFGDDYLAQHATKVYAIHSNKIKGEISETLKELTLNNIEGEVHKRIELDCRNLVRFDHFINGENWDIAAGMIKMIDQKQSKKTYK